MSGSARSCRRSQSRSAGIALEQGDQVEPRLDPRPVEQRRAEIGGEQARAGAGDACGRPRRAGCRRGVPDAETVSSRLSRVAASIIIWSPAARATGGRRKGSDSRATSSR